MTGWVAWLGLVCGVLILGALGFTLLQWFREEWDDEGWDW